MPKMPESNELDLSSLYGLSVEEPKMTRLASSSKLKLADNLKRFQKIGFDLFRDSESEFIWKLVKDSETGEEFITRTASLDPLFTRAEHWSAEVESSKSSISLIYKGHSIKAFKKAELNLDEENTEEWRRFLVDQVATDPTFLSKVVATLSPERKKYIITKFPELMK